MDTTINKVKNVIKFEDKFFSKAILITNISNEDLLNIKSEILNSKDKYLL